MSVSSYELLVVSAIGHWLLAIGLQGKRNLMRLKPKFQLEKPMAKR
jgi:hypothetical protein